MKYKVNGDFGTQSQIQFKEMVVNEKIMDVQSKLIVNRSSYKTKTNEIESIISNFKSNKKNSKQHKIIKHVYIICRRKRSRAHCV